MFWQQAVDNKLLIQNTVCWIETVNCTSVNCGWQAGAAILDASSGCLCTGTGILVPWARWWQAGSAFWAPSAHACWSKNFILSILSMHTSSGLLQGLDPVSLRELASPGCLCQNSFAPGKVTHRFLATSTCQTSGWSLEDLGFGQVCSMSDLLLSSACKQAEAKQEQNP